MELERLKVSDIDMIYSHIEGNMGVEIEDVTDNNLYLTIFVRSKDGREINIKIDLNSEVELVVRFNNEERYETNFFISPSNTLQILMHNLTGYINKPSKSQNYKTNMVTIVDYIFAVNNEEE